MYEEFFGLRSKPFSVTPSAELFFHSVTHRRTLAYLQGQTLAGEPLIVLTGDIGAGKTTVLQVLLRNLSDKFAPAVVVSTQLDEIEFTRSVLIAFGARAAGNSLDDLRTALRIHLEDLRSRGRPGLLVVDEAQNLSANTLRHLMRLSEPGDDAEEEAGLQVIISGQLGLQALLMEVAGERRGDELPLYRLAPMSTRDTGAYVRHRLRIVGTGDGPTFSEDAIEQVQTATGGLPRLVNRLCHRVLMSACLDQARDIDGVRVADAAAELREELGDSDIPDTDLDKPQPMQAGPILSHPTPPEPIRVGSGVDSAPALAGPVPSFLRESPKRPDAQARGRQRSYWVAAVAAGFLAASLGWLGYDRSSPRNAARLDTARAAGGVVPAERADGAVHTRDASTLSAESPARPLYPDGHSPVESSMRDVQEPRAPPSQSVDPQAALGLAPSTEPTTSPPAGGPACSDAAKALGLCP